MFRRLLLPVLLVFALTGAVTAKPASFGVAAHSNVNIEWWYINAHVTTAQGRHLALIGSFFRFGNGINPLDPLQPAPRAHYLIYAVTDLDKKTQVSYSLADTKMVTLLHQIAPLLVGMNPHDKGAEALLSALQQGKLPPGNQEIPGAAKIVNTPFHLAYGAANTLTADNTADTSFTLNLAAAGGDQIHLTFAAQKPPMAVGGTGLTGLSKPSDMYYYSLTRCRVGGTINTGTGLEKIVGGEGWFDHQWGNSWVVQNDGWDWWGVQLNNGTDILLFRQRNLTTGKTFFPLATFMDKDGHQSVTKDIVFTPQPGSAWTSPKTGITYPLAWTIAFPKKHLTLHVKAAVKDQEMQILGPGSAIWEGACRVTARQGAVPATSGVAYMELVGYNSPAVKAQAAQAK